MEAQLFNAKIAVRSIALPGAITLLLGSPAVMAQGRGNGRTGGSGIHQSGARRDGPVRRVRPRKRACEADERICWCRGRSPACVRDAITPLPCDVVRANVYSREGDSRDAEVRSFEILQTSGDNNNQRLNGQRPSGTVVSANHRSSVMVMRTDNGRTLNVDLGTYNGRGNSTARNFRAGDRITVTGRMDRGTVIADAISINSTRR
jgi:hypothetical protein